ncbi:MAG: hypothetical protein ACRDSL_10165 [Pseudonocardiaceae bacterium]
MQPARPYFYVGRVRDRAEWPDTLLDDGSGTVGRLEPTQQGAVLLEPSYVVPFGNRNRVAIMNMSRPGSTRSARLISERSFSAPARPLDDCSHS